MARVVLDRFHTKPLEMIGGFLNTLLVLGGLTILSLMVFRGLRREDGDSVSQHKHLPHVE